MGPVNPTVIVLRWRIWEPGSGSAHNSEPQLSQAGAGDLKNFWKAPVFRKRWLLMSARHGGDSGNRRIEALTSKMQAHRTTSS